MLNLLEKKAFRRGGGSFRHDRDGGSVIVIEDEDIKECKEEKENN